MAVITLSGDQATHGRAGHTGMPKEAWSYLLAGRRYDYI